MIIFSGHLSLAWKHPLVLLLHQGFLLQETCYRSWELIEQRRTGGQLLMHANHWTLIQVPYKLLAGLILIHVIGASLVHAGLPGSEILARAHRTCERPKQFLFLSESRAGGSILNERRILHGHGLDEVGAL